MNSPVQPTDSTNSPQEGVHNTGGSLLTDALKQDIQTAYSAWLDARGFKPRRGQREMIAHVARTLTGQFPRICVIEAGTGTGKTAGYCMAAIPAAQAMGKTVVLAMKAARF